MKEILIGIYKITNPSGKIYIGCSEDIYKRWKSYSYSCNIKSQKFIFNSICKYGTCNHKFEIIEILINSEKLEEREVYWINYYKSYYKDSDIGLNLTRGGNYPPNRKGLKSSDEHKKKISEANKGRKHTEETKRKIRLARKNQIFTEEHNKKRGEALRGKSSKLKGRKNPKTSEKLKGRITAVSIKCLVLNKDTGIVTEAESMQQLSRKSGISISSLLKIREGKIVKKYINYEYRQ